MSDTEREMELSSVNALVERIAMKEKHLNVISQEVHHHRPIIYNINTDYLRMLLVGARYTKERRGNVQKRN